MSWIDANRAKALARNKVRAVGACMYTHRLAFLVGALFLMLSLIYNTTTPLWESDNEWSHYQYVRYILDHHTLPKPDSQVTTQVTPDACTANLVGALASSHQFRQPPLYYLLGAALISQIDVGTGWQAAVNPHVFADPDRAGINIVVHSPVETFPYHGTLLAVHILRLMSGLIGLSGLVATYLSGLVLFDGDRRLASAAMALTAFVPQYVFSSSVVNNDILVGALGSWTVYFCLSAVRRESRTASPILAGLAAGLAVIAKLSGALLPLLSALAIVVRFVSGRRRSRARRTVLASALGLLITAGGLGALVWFGQANSSPEQSSSLLSVLSYVPAIVRESLAGSSGSTGLLDPVRAAHFTFMTYWGLLGNDMLALPPLLLRLLLLVCLVAGAGLLRILLARTTPRATRFQVVAGVAFVAVAWAVIALRSVGTSEPRGRYLLPIYSTIGLLWALGIHSIAPVGFKSWANLAMGVMLFSLAAWVPPFLIHPAYAQPQLARTAELLPGEQPIQATFGGFAKLIGYRLEPTQVGVYERLQVTLVWEATGMTANNYTLTLQLLDGVYRAHGAVHTFPGHGNFATSLWRPGDIFRETYDLYLEPSARDSLPSVGRVKVTLHCYGQAGDPQLEVTDAQSAVAGDAVYLDRVKLVADGLIRPATDVPESILVFGDEIGLLSDSVAAQSWQAGETLEIRLTWVALQRPGEDYTVFAHLVNPQGEIIARDDQPLGDVIYPSGLWERGDRITHVHHLRIPRDAISGDYTLYMGLYSLASGRRLPIRQADADLATDDRFVAAVIHVHGFRRVGFLPLIQTGLVEQVEP